MLYALPHLAQQTFSSEIFLWLGVIVAAAILLGVIAAWLRRRFVSEPPPIKLGFTLADLREMHSQGQISDEEFAAAKAKMLARNRMELDEDAQTKQAKPALPAAESEHPPEADKLLEELDPVDPPEDDGGEDVDNDLPESDRPR
jgi:hypothetical protein